MHPHRTPLRKPITLTIEVAGVPAPQGSKTVGRSASGASWVRDDNPHTAPWRATVAAAAAKAMSPGLGHTWPMLHGPVKLYAEFRFPRPKGHYRTGKAAGQLRPAAPFHPSGRPDLDKLLRAVGDAIAGIVLVDDAQIISVSASKRYGEAGATIRVDEIRV